MRGRPRYSSLSSYIGKSQSPSLIQDIPKRYTQDTTAWCVCIDLLLFLVLSIQTSAVPHAGQSALSLKINKSGKSVPLFNSEDQAPAWTEDATWAGVTGFLLDLEISRFGGGARGTAQIFVPQSCSSEWSVALSSGRSVDLDGQAVKLTSGSVSALCDMNMDNVWKPCRLDSLSLHLLLSAGI